MNCSVANGETLTLKRDKYTKKTQKILPSNISGFLTAVDDNIRGNYGMLDMVQALRWVRDNIAFFNGDPNQVTIDGHSAGGCSVGFLLMSPLAKGIYGNSCTVNCAWLFRQTSNKLPIFDSVT